eukprot:TRINITY_DN1485_c0_g1_i1.p1 TRINITY_DN1485_c0_g1~~TRINITY_DN1485_c0_g1_i1.p1  ORF type:complete len:398 (+),score=70.43 TRINITY_DN1485_c0_g1_i1:219-1412(+)
MAPKMSSRATKGDDPGAGEEKKKKKKEAKVADDSKALKKTKSRDHTPPKDEGKGSKSKEKHADAEISFKKAERISSISREAEGSSHMSSSSKKSERSSSSSRDAEGSSSISSTPSKAESKAEKAKSSEKPKRSSRKKVPANLIYVLVARGTVVLCDYTSYKGNFAAIALDCLEHLNPSDGARQTAPHGEHALNFLIDGGFTYMVLADVDCPKESSFGLLERIKADFTLNFGKRGAKAPKGSLNRDYKNKLKDHIQYVTDHPEEMNKFSKIKSQVAEVKGIMKDNLEKALNRGEKLEVLNLKTDLLKDQASLFQKQGKQLEQKLWYENMKTKLFIFGGFALLALLAFWFLIGSNLNFFPSGPTYIPTPYITPAAPIPVVVTSTPALVATSATPVYSVP